MGVFENDIKNMICGELRGTHRASFVTPKPCRSSRSWLQVWERQTGKESDFTQNKTKGFTTRVWFLAFCFAFVLCCLKSDSLLVCVSETCNRDLEDLQGFPYLPCTVASLECFPRCASNELDFMKLLFLVVFGNQFYNVFNEAHFETKSPFVWSFGNSKIHILLFQSFAKQGCRRIACFKRT